MQQTDWRDEPITIEQNRAIYYIGGGALLVILGIIIGAVLFAGENPTVDEPSGYYTNLFTEMMGITVTVFILNALARRREDARLKDQLVSQARSTANGVAVGAVDMLRHKGWLTGEHGALQGADLYRANLENAYLSGANLQEAGLFEANLQGASLVMANLQGADLLGADFQGAFLPGAKLQGAFLVDADFQGANLVDADFQGAVLSGADFQGADLREAKLQNAYIEITHEKFKTQFDGNTTLPDKTKWTPDTDWTRFGAFTDQDAYKAWRKSQQQDGDE